MKTEGGLAGPRGELSLKRNRFFLFPVGEGRRRKLRIALGRSILSCFFCVSLFGARAEEPWQGALSQMPLRGKAEQLNQTNCVHLLLMSFQSNRFVKALVIMPGATDELYLWRRVTAQMRPAAQPSLLDAFAALTNQTRLQVTFRTPFLLVYVAGESLEPRAEVEDVPTAQKLKAARFKPWQCFEDSDWDAVQPVISWSLKLDIRPWRYRADSWHFYRQNIAAWGLNGWEAVEAVALASKTRFTVGRKRVTFALNAP